MNQPRQLCTFTVDDLYLGVDVMEVQEVIRYQEMTAVPLAPEVVRGLINLRGQIVTALDLRRMLDLPPLEGDELPTNVVIRDGADEAVSLLVDQIGDVVDTDPADFEPPPPTLSGPARDLVLGAYKLPHALLLVLDTERVQNSQRPAAARV
ncbi:chemotaxis protein CheW [Sporichthya polymorpha]|uniref:chemotaxis protein CheW n=1 Tax=Sporichthya polymorpha TaxID=35751 RepID=UPI000371288A|nr:chemotaxis protein CheW [Sporichthya polymorpha]